MRLLLSDWLALEALDCQSSQTSGAFVNFPVHISHPRDRLWRGGAGPALRCLPSGVMPAAPVRTPAQHLSSVRRRLRRAVLARRRLLASVCAALAVLVAVQAVREPAVRTVPVLVATVDLPAGRPLTRGDVAEAQYAERTVPAGAMATSGSVVGRTLAAPLRQGEPLTDVRLVGPGLLDGYPDRVVTPVRVADADAARLVTVGDHVDLVASDPESGRTEVVAPGAPVVAVPRARSRSAGLASGALLVVAVTASESLALAGAASTSVLSVAFSR